jgi:dipeptidyl aminopeptidase/acylaminoacyl peptidase
VLIGALSTARAAAQTSTAQPVTHADYERAKRVLRASALARNVLVVPHWIAGRDEFWYQRETAAGGEYVTVDAATGRARPAFDHQAMATALAAAEGHPESAAKLPITDLGFNRDGSLRVTVPAPPDAGVVPTADGRFFTVVERAFDCRLGPPPAARCTLISGSGAPEGLAVSPDGRSSALVKDGNLWVKDLASGTERQLTRDGEGTDYGYGVYPDGWKAARIPRERQLALGHRLPPFETSWSPDSRTILVAKVDQRHVAPYPFIETVPGDGSFRPKAHAVRIPLIGEKPPIVEWFAVDVPTGKVTRIAFPYEQLLVLQQDLVAFPKTWWGPDHRHLFAVAHGDNMESAFLFDADLETGTVRTVVEERGRPRVDLNSTSYNPPNIHVSPDGKQLIWWSQRDGWGHLYRYDMANGKLMNRITTGPWLVRDLIKVDESRGLVYFTGGGREGGNPYYRHLYRVNFDGTGLTLLSPEPADAMLTGEGNSILALDGGAGYDVVSPSGKYVVYNVSTPSRPTESVIRTTADGRLVATFERADASVLLAAGFRLPEEFEAKTADGAADTWNVIYRPANFDSSRRYPVIDAQYASPLTAVAPRNFAMAIRGAPGANAPALAALGFVTVIIDGRGTTYRSREFTQSAYGKLAINGLDDHVAAIQQLGRRFAFVDTTRVGITGGSYGGWSTFRGMLEFPDFYSVGVAESPPGSMQNMYLDYHWTAQQGRPIYQNGTELRPGPTDVPTNWNAVDGRQQASRLKGHLLVIMSELDENVLPGSPLQLIDALMKADKNFDLIYLPDTPHGSGRYTPYTTRRRWDYFVRYLMGATPPGT